MAYDHKLSGSFVIARSFEEFLTKIRIAVKRRQFVVTKDGIAEHRKHKNWDGSWAEECEPRKPRKPSKRKKKPKRPRPRSR